MTNLLFYQPVFGWYYKRICRILGKVETALGTFVLIARTDLGEFKFVPAESVESPELSRIPAFVLGGGVCGYNA